MNNLQRRFTSDNITELPDGNSIFVFGSNLSGNHAGGAAKTALEKFGAIQGKGEGLQGQSYAIPTLDKNMEKIPLDEISKSIDTLYAFADENADLDFYVTKIGTGIAGYSIEEIAEIFKSKEFQPFNVFLPMEFTFIKGVKGFDKDMKCRDMQFEENKTFEHHGEVKCCESGLHFCENPLETLHFYPYKEENNYCFSVGHEKIDFSQDDTKISVSKLDIKAKINLNKIIDSGIDFILRKISFILKRANAHSSTAVANAHSSTAVTNAHSSTAVTNAHSSTAVARGSSSTAVANAHSSTAVARGSYNTAVTNAHSSTAVANEISSTAVANEISSTAVTNAHSSTAVARGSYSTAVTRGISSTAVTNAHYSTAVTNAHSSTAVARGSYSTAVLSNSNNSKVKAVKGCAIFIVERNIENEIIHVFSGIVDGVNIKEDVFYTLKDGKLVEVKD